MSTNVEQIKEIVNFLEKSNKNTYANKDASKVRPSRLKSEDYHFKKGDFVYHDTYFGARDFIGEEIIYKKDIPAWGANYYGYMFSKITDEKELYSFLRQALMQKYSDIIPVRGPKEYMNKEWKYTNKIKGNLDRFAGIEEIWQENELLYRCNYHGGFIG